MVKLHVCACGGFKFYCDYALLECAVCGKIQPGHMMKEYVPVWWPMPTRQRETKPPKSPEVEAPSSVLCDW